MAGRNLGEVIRFEVVRTLTKRRFWVSTLFVPVLLGVVFALVISSNQSNHAASDAQAKAKFQFEYTDASGIVVPQIAAAAGGTKITDAAAGIRAVRDGRLDAFFDYPATPTTDAVRIAATDSGVFTNGRYDAVAQAVLQQSAKARLGNPTLAAIAANGVRTDTTTYADGQVAGGFDQLLPPLVFVLLFYLVIALLGNQMLTSTLEEKENRVTEMILTTIDARSLILGKIVALFTIGFVQILVFVIPVVGGYLAFREQLNFPQFDLSHLIFDPGQMIVGALLLIGGYGLFTGTLVALGAIMPTAKDAGPIFAAVIVMIFVPFYIVTTILSTPDAVIVQVFTYFPFTAPITAMLRNALGSLSGWQAAIVIAELYLASAIMLAAAVRLFRTGSLEYTSRVSIRRAFRSR